MDVLDKLSPGQRNLVISLPYRVGLWISKSDDTGGEEAQDKELTALSNILQGFSAQVFGSELLQYIMDETTHQQENWPNWAQNVENVPEECKQALDVLRQHVDEKDVNAYSQRLIEIGEAVALAFREYEDQSFGDQLKIYSSYILTKVKSRFSKQPAKSFEQFLNISISERKALAKLANALGTQYSI